MRSSFELYQRARLVGLRALGFRVPKALLVCVCVRLGLGFTDVMFVVSSTSWLSQCHFLHGTIGRGCFFFVDGRIEVLEALGIGVYISHCLKRRDTETIRFV